MATERLLMRHIREILRLKWTLRRSHRDTARSLGISAGAVASVVTRAKAMALTWDAVRALSDDALERTLYGPTLALTVARPGPDLVWMHTEPKMLRQPLAFKRWMQWVPALYIADRTSGADADPTCIAFRKTIGWTQWAIVYVR